MRKVWDHVKKTLKAIGRAQSFILLTASYFLAFLPFALANHMTRQGRRAFYRPGWRDPAPAPSTLEEAKRQ